jgi:hypothetical protein
MAKGVSMPAVAAAGVAGLFIWSGLKGVSVVGGLKSLVTGQQPSSSEIYTLTAPGSTPVGSGATATGNAVADTFQSYIGSGSVYLWGGGNPKTGWDCSGSCNYVICHDLGMAIPGYKGGSFNGSSHGPTTMLWAIWSGATTIPRSQVQAGDLVIWPAFHMGIAISNTEMVNCPGPNGTPNPVIGNITGGGTGPLVCRRLRAENSGLPAQALILHKGV